MPVNGHTSGVSVLGSDKKCAEQRKPRRRMRDWLCMKNNSRFAAAGKGQQRGGRCGKRRETLLIKTRFRERLSRWSGPLMGCSATSLVRTAPRLTRLWARRIRHDAWSCRQSNGRRKKRRDDYKTNRDPAEHSLIDSMPIAPRPAGTVMETAHHRR
jgi:hypothetical protein